jgi:hypothetical protein
VEYLWKQCKKGPISNLQAETRAEDTIERFIFAETESASHSINTAHYPSFPLFPRAYYGYGY